MTAQEVLISVIEKFGPIKTARVSSAQAKGAAKTYSYYGAVRYQVYLNRRGVLSNRALERASSDRRSYRLAEQDCEALGRIRLQTIGELSEQDCHTILKSIVK